MLCDPSIVEIEESFTIESVSNLLQSALQVTTRGVKRGVVVSSSPLSPSMVHCPTRQFAVHACNQISTAAAGEALEAIFDPIEVPFSGIVHPSKETKTQQTLHSRLSCNGPIVAAFIVGPALKLGS
jgi:hypothetical protein